MRRWRCHSMTSGAERCSTSALTRLRDWATLMVQVVHNGVASTLTLTLSGVEQLVITRPEAPPWDYTEITEAHAAESGARVQIDLTFWTEPHGLSATCAAWTVRANA